MTQTKSYPFVAEQFQAACRKASTEPGTIWLDSSLHTRDRGRYSYLARRPLLDVAIHDNAAAVTEPGRTSRRLTTPDSLTLLKSLWADPSCFSAGYISYEAALPFIAPELQGRKSPIPPMRWLFYDSVLEFDNLTQTTRSTNHGSDTDALLGDSPRWPEYMAPARPRARFSHARSRSDYLDCIATIKRHIYEGDIYQANFTARIDVESDEDPALVYYRLRSLNPAPYSAYCNFGDYQILSSSPERMFRKDGDQVTTGPIKGTIARGRNEAEDRVNLQRLMDSTKDQAELLMIVDLARNDLGRIAEIGSVSVDSLFRPELYASVIHLVADISCRIQPDSDIIDVIRSLLPGGSITGAPKKRAVEIIDALEDTPRSIYTGCIGYVCGRRADFSLAIRTMVHRNGIYHIHAGGGIVADSQPEAEFDEMRLKAARLLSAVGLIPGRISWPT